MSDVAMAISTDTDADVAYLNHLVCDIITADRAISDGDQLLGRH